MNEIGSLEHSPRKLLRAVEVAEILSISRAFAYQLMQRGEIRTVVIGSARRVRPEDLDEFIASCLSPNGFSKITQ